MSEREREKERKRVESRVLKMADFVGKQFSEEDVASKVVEQYDEEHTRIFYQCVMGGGGDDIHFGLFKKPEWGVRESSEATTEFMLQSLDWARPLGEDSHVLDAGSGHGGAAHTMAMKYGCKVTCFNLGPNQNELNRARAETLGIGSKLTIKQGDLNAPLPKEWENSFDAVHSCEVFCHAANKEKLLKELYRVLKPGGAIVFSDIMGADEANEESLRAFTDRNATTFMGRPSKYLAAAKAAGFQYVQFADLSHHLEKYFHCMCTNINEGRAEMEKKGVPSAYLDNWLQSLTDREEIQKKEGVFSWGVFVFRKAMPGDPFYTRTGSANGSA